MGRPAGLAAPARCPRHPAGPPAEERSRHRVGRRSRGTHPAARVAPRHRRTPVPVDRTEPVEPAARLARATGHRIRRRSGPSIRARTVGRWPSSLRVVNDWSIRVIMAGHGHGNHGSPPWRRSCYRSGDTVARGTAAAVAEARASGAAHQWHSHRPAGGIHPTSPVRTRATGSTRDPCRPCNGALRRTLPSRIRSTGTRRRRTRCPARRTPGRRCRRLRFPELRPGRGRHPRHAASCRRCQ